MRYRLRQVPAGRDETPCSILLVIVDAPSVVLDGQALVDRIGHNNRFDDVLRSDCYIRSHGLVGFEVHHDALGNELHRRIVSSLDQFAVSRSRPLGFHVLRPIHDVSRWKSRSDSHADDLSRDILDEDS